MGLGYVNNKLKEVIDKSVTRIIDGLIKDDNENLVKQVLLKMERDPYHWLNFNVNVSVSLKGQKDFHWYVYRRSSIYTEDLLRYYNMSETYSDWDIEKLKESLHEYCICIITEHVNRLQNDLRDNTHITVFEGDKLEKVLHRDTIQESLIYL